MNWIKMADEKPKHKQRVFYAVLVKYTNEPAKNYYSYKGHLQVYHPVEENKMFSSDWWERQDGDQVHSTHRVEVRDDDIWCALELPKVGEI